MACRMPIGSFRTSRRSSVPQFNSPSPSEPVQALSGEERQWLRDLEGHRGWQVLQRFLSQRRDSLYRGLLQAQEPDQVLRQLGSLQELEKVLAFRTQLLLTPSNS